METGDRIDVHGLCCYVGPTHAEYPTSDCHVLKSDQDLIRVLELSSPTRDVLKVCYDIYYAAYEVCENDSLGYEEYVEEEDNHEY
jgi:hypothetical protein